MMGDDSTSLWKDYDLIWERWSNSTNTHKLWDIKMIKITIQYTQWPYCSIVHQFHEFVWRIAVEKSCLGFYSPALKKSSDCSFERQREKTQHSIQSLRKAKSGKKQPEKLRFCKQGKIQGKMKNEWLVVLLWPPFFRHCQMVQILMDYTTEKQEKEQWRALPLCNCMQYRSYWCNFTMRILFSDFFIFLFEFLCVDFVWNMYWLSITALHVWDAPKLT